MIKFIPINLILIFSFIALTGCSNDNDTIFGSGTVINQIREVQNFTSISNLGVMDLNISYVQRKCLRLPQMITSWLLLKRMLVMENLTFI